MDCRNDDGVEVMYDVEVPAEYIHRIEGVYSGDPSSPQLKNTDVGEALSMSMSALSPVSASPASPTGSATKMKKTPSKRASIRRQTATVIIRSVNSKCLRRFQDGESLDGNLNMVSPGSSAGLSPFQQSIRTFSAKSGEGFSPTLETQEQWDIQSAANTEGGNMFRSKSSKGVRAGRHSTAEPERNSLFEPARRSSLVGWWNGLNLK
jgi:hypothetical protein